MGLAVAEGVGSPATNLLPPIWSKFTSPATNPKTPCGLSASSSNIRCMWLPMEAMADLGILKLWIFPMCTLISPRMKKLANWHRPGTNTIRFMSPSTKFGLRTIATPPAAGICSPVLSSKPDAIIRYPGSQSCNVDSISWVVPCTS